LAGPQTGPAKLTSWPTRLKNQVQAILHRNVIPGCPAADLFGVKGRCWLSDQHLPADEELAVEALLPQIDFHAQENCGSSTTRWAGSLWSARRSRLMPIPGVDTTLQEAALGATRTKDSYLQAQYQRLKPRLGHRRALGAVQHSMLIAYWHMFTNGETYRELGGDYYQRRDFERLTKRLTKRLVARLQSLGHNVTLTPAAA
jgi:hypothetical protein